MKGKNIFCSLILLCVFIIVAILNFQSIQNFFIYLYEIINKGIGEADPNWLLATCAQSAAAIIAIIGGFIVSRILALSSEKNSIVAQIKELNIKVNSKFKEYKEEEKKIIEWKVHKDLDSSFKGMVNRGKDLKVDKIVEKKVNKFKDLNNFMISKLSMEDLLPYYRKISSVIKEAYNYLDSFDQLPSNNDIMNDSNIREEEKKIYRSVLQALTSSNNNVPPYSPNNSILNTLEIYNNVMEVKSRTYNQVTNSLFAKKTEYESLKVQRNELKQRLKNFKNPKGLFKGILVFGYFTLVGVIFPIAFIPFAKEEFSTNIKWGIFLLFTTGIASVFAYILQSVFNLMKIDNNIFEK